MVKRIKNIKANSNYDSENFIKKFIILTIIIIVLVIAFYFLTDVLVQNKKDNNTNNTTSVSIDYNKVNVGTILNRPYDEYLVMVYDSESKDAVYYSSLITKYQSKDVAKKLYFCDLANGLNEKYFVTDDKTNTKDSNVENLRFGDITLLDIKDGKIIKSYEKIEDIQKVLK